ncbi:MAG: DUF3769 domain-containing protein [Cyanobacteriota bacterium]|nr:DUF3769 domain-containing protein [Cyanobacteriota bacterium]
MPFFSLLLPLFTDPLAVATLPIRPEGSLMAQQPPSAAQQLRQPLPQAQQLQPLPTPLPPSDPAAPALHLSAQALQLRSDQQTFNPVEEVFEAIGNVEMKLGRSRLRAERMRIDLKQRTVTAEGNVQVELGQQVIRGERLTYDFTQETGSLDQASGEIDIASLPSDTRNAGLTNDRIGDPLPSPSPSPGARIVRFRAERIRFDAQNWQGENVRITNDPLDPPELEIRSPLVTSQRQADGSSIINAEAGQLAFDQAFFLPVPLRFRLDQFQRQTPISIFYDDFDREDQRRGLTIQPNFELSRDPRFSFVLSPQLYPQRLLGSNQGLLDGVGVQTRLRVAYPDGQATHVLAELRGLVFEELADRLRIQIEQRIPTGDGGQVTYTYAHRQRFFSGLLGFQIVQNRLGVTYSSPVIPMGETGIDLSYQISADQIDALGQAEIDADPTLAKTTTERLQLSRLQLGTALSRSFALWSPEAETEGSLAVGSPMTLRFSPTPIEQGLWLNTGVSSSQSFYSDGKAQSYVSGTIGFNAILGDFQADAFDFTNINVTYSNGFLAGASPFLFDRITTREQLILGFLQQIYGPIRVGAQTTVDLQSGQRVDTTYTLGYDRRTYGLSVQFNPVRQTGAVELRIDNFNWEGPEGETEVRGGIERDK